MYRFDGRDVGGFSGDVSNETGDNLVHIMMEDGERLSWSVLRISIAIDGAASMTCDESFRADNYSQCQYFIDEGDNYWDIYEEITIAEGDDYDLCNDGCEVRVTIIKMGVGGDDDKMLADVYAYAN